MRRFKMAEVNKTYGIPYSFCSWYFAMHFALSSIKVMVYSVFLGIHLEKAYYFSKLFFPKYLDFNKLSNDVQHNLC